MAKPINGVNGFSGVNGFLDLNGGLINGFINGHIHGHVNDHVHPHNQKDQNILRVLMFPWLAHGHISPFLELANKLANTKKFVVYLCSTPVNLISVKEKLKGNFSSSIKLVELHLEESNGLKSCFHTTNGLPPHLMDTLKQAFKNSIPTFKNILNSLKPDLLIYDSIQPWAADAAKEKSIPAVDFITSSTTMTSFCFHLFKNPQGKGNDFPFIDTIHYRAYEKHFLENIVVLAENQNIEKESSIECIEKSDIVLIKGMNNIEGKYCDYLSKLCGKKILLVGPLVQEPNKDDENSHIIKWLNQKSEKSTIFVSFGSEYFLTAEEREKIAQGLMLTNVNFVWVVRFPKDVEGKKVNLEDSFPKGFLTSIGDRGLVVEGWAPQVKILEHPSVGGFVSHCGWSSIMESMKCGVPIIAMPMHLDQPVNSRLVEEVGMGIEVVRSENGKLNEETIANVIEKVVFKEEGKAVRDKAKEISEKIACNDNEEMDEVVKALEKICTMKKKTKKTTEEKWFLPVAC